MDGERLVSDRRGHSERHQKRRLSARLVYLTAKAPVSMQIYNHIRISLPSHLVRLAYLGFWNVWNDDPLCTSCGHGWCDLGYSASLSNDLSGFMPWVILGEGQLARDTNLSEAATYGHSVTYKRSAQWHPCVSPLDVGEVKVRRGRSKTPQRSIDHTPSLCSNSSIMMLHEASRRARSVSLSRIGNYRG